MADPWGSPFTLGTVDVACSVFVYLLLRCVPQKELYSIHDMEQRVERLVELNVMEQVCLAASPMFVMVSSRAYWLMSPAHLHHPTVADSHGSTPHTHFTTHHFAVLALG